MNSDTHFHSKTLFEIAMALLTISVSFPSKSRCVSGHTLWTRTHLFECNRGALNQCPHIYTSKGHSFKGMSTRCLLNAIDTWSLCPHMNPLLIYTWACKLHIHIHTCTFSAMGKSLHRRCSALKSNGQLIDVPLHECSLNEFLGVHLACMYLDMHL